MLKRKSDGISSEKGIFTVYSVQDRGGSRAYMQPTLGTHPSQGIKDTHIHSQGQFRIDNSLTRRILGGERKVEKQEEAHTDTGTGGKTPHTTTVPPRSSQRC